MRTLWPALCPCLFLLRSGFLFSHGLVLLGCVDVGTHPFLSDNLICWHIIALTLLRFFILFVISGVNASSFNSDFLKFFSVFKATTFNFVALFYCFSGLCFAYLFFSIFIILLPIITTLGLVCFHFSLPSSLGCYIRWFTWDLLLLVYCHKRPSLIIFAVSQKSWNTMFLRLSQDTSKFLSESLFWPILVVLCQVTQFLDCVSYFPYGFNRVPGPVTRGRKTSSDSWIEGPAHQDGSGGSRRRNTREQKLLLSLLTRLRPHLGERCLLYLGRGFLPNWTNLENPPQTFPGVSFHHGFKSHQTDNQD